MIRKPSPSRRRVCRVARLRARAGRRARPSSPPRSAPRSRRSSRTIWSQHPEVLQEAMRELEKRQTAAEAAQTQGRGQGARQAVVQLARPGHARQSEGRRHLRRVLRLQLRLLQARHDRHAHADEDRSESQGRAQGIPGARPRLGGSGQGRGRRAHAGQDRQEISRVPPEAPGRPRPRRPRARARRRQGDRPRHGPGWSRT